MRRLLAASSLSVLTLTLGGSRSPPQSIEGPGVRNTYFQYHTTLEEAKTGLDDLLRSGSPGLFVISAPWCSYCQVLERDLRSVATPKRHVVVAQISPPERPRALLMYISAREGIPFSDPDYLIPATIIVNGAARIPTQGYDARADDVHARVLVTDTRTSQGIPLGHLF